MTISALLANHHCDVLTASPAESVTDVISRLSKYRIGALPVVHGQAVIGIFSERDIVYGVTQHDVHFFDEDGGLYHDRTSHYRYA